MHAQTGLAQQWFKYPKVSRSDCGFRNVIHHTHKLYIHPRDKSPTSKPKAKMYIAHVHVYMEIEVCMNNVYMYMYMQLAHEQLPVFHCKEQKEQREIREKHHRL